MASIACIGKFSLSLSLIILLLTTISSPASAQLSSSFYQNTCPGVFQAVQEVVGLAVDKERRMGASLIRLFFHDCFVDGCDGGILLSGGEQNAAPNANSARGFNVIADAKNNVDAKCGSGIVSCADILAIAARDSVVKLGGPTYDVLVGRRDARTSNPDGTLQQLPAFFANIDTLISNFKSKGLSERDLVALSGAHTVGLARCVTFRDHIYNDTNIDPSYANSLKSNCPSAQNQGDNNFANLDSVTPSVFDNQYFKNLVNKRGLLHSDQELLGSSSTDSIVRAYSQNGATFFSDFKAAMIKMGNLSPLTGSQGEIRNDCSKVN